MAACPTSAGSAPTEAIARLGREAPDPLRLRQPGAGPSGTPGREPHQPVLACATSSGSPGTAGRGPGRPGPEIVVDQAITALDPAGHLAYRGWDATRAAVDAHYEEVAAWLWGTTFGPNDHWTRRPRGCRDRPAGAGRAPGRRRPSRTGCASPSPRSAPATRLRDDRRVRGRGRTRRHTPGHPRRGAATGRPARRAVVDRLTGATTLDARVAPRTDDPSRAGARPRAVAARRPRARDVDAGGARGRLGLGGSLPAAPHRPRDRGRTAARRGVGVRPRPSPRRGGDRRRDGRRTRACATTSACPGSVTRSTRVPIRGRRCSSTRSRRAGRPATSGAPPQVCST